MRNALCGALLRLPQPLLQLQRWRLLTPARLMALPHLQASQMPGLLSITCLLTVIGRKVVYNHLYIKAGHSAPNAPFFTCSWRAITWMPSSTSWSMSPSCACMHHLNTSQPHLPC